MTPFFPLTSTREIFLADRKKQEMTPTREILGKCTSIEKDVRSLKRAEDYHSLPSIADSLKEISSQMEKRAKEEQFVMIHIEPRIPPQDSYPYRCPMIPTSAVRSEFLLIAAAVLSSVLL